MSANYYCSLETFHSIIKGKSLWLSEMSKTNDSEDGKAIIGRAKEIFEAEFQKTRKVKWFSEAFKTETFNRIIQGHENHFTDFFEKNSVYITCFSDRKDLLSQWRGYADDGRGIDICFDYNALKDICETKTDDPKLQFKRIEYNRASQGKIIRDSAKECIKQLKMAAKSMEDVDLFNQANQIVTERFDGLIKESVFTKNIAFNEEKETRLLFITPKMDNEAYTLTNGIVIEKPGTIVKNGDIIVTHRNLNFGDHFPEMINEIIIGPKCKMSVLDMETFLQQNGFSKGIKVSYSTLTYR